MTTTKKRPSTLVAVTKIAIDYVQGVLKQLPEKPKETLSVGEAVEVLYGDITSALARGYTLEEIVDLLTNKGVDINVSSLKYHLSRLKKKTTAPQAKSSKHRKQQSKAIAVQPQVAVISATSAQDEATAPEPTVAPSKAGSGAEPVSSEAPDHDSTTTTKPASRRRTNPTVAKPTKGATRAAAKTKPTAKTTSIPSRKKKETT